MVLDALLALQNQDDVVDGLAARIDALTPRLTALDTARQGALRTLEETKALVEADERRQRELEGRITDHRQKQERHLAHLDAVKRMREATAAMLQVEAGRKLLMEEESELRSLVARIADGHGVIKRQEAALEQLDLEQAEEREAIAAERDRLQEELDGARAARQEIAASVDGALLHKYDRIRNRRHAHAVFALNGAACGCCDTAVPVQRRKVMASSGNIEVCETCGVLLYASE